MGRTPMTLTHSLAAPETPPVTPRNSPPLQASAKDRRELDSRNNRTPFQSESWSIGNGTGNVADFKIAAALALYPSLRRSSTSRRRGPSCSRRRCGPRPCDGSRA